MTVIYICYC